jgi:glucosamine-6-phosphate deaminase
MYHQYRSHYSEAVRPDGSPGQLWPKPRALERSGMAKEHSGAGLRIVRKENAAAVGQEAAEIVAEHLTRKPDSAIVFPTGKTPLPMYRALRSMPRIEWSHSRLFQLDEYIPPHPERAPRYETFADFMRRELWTHIDGKKHYLQDYFSDPATYEHLVTEGGGPDLVILGIGANGHVAFNEPGSLPDSPIRRIDLTEETLRSNFGAIGLDECPHQAITMGLKTILGAKQVLLLATGAGKCDIVQLAFDPKTPPSLEYPASWLKIHPNTLVLCDFEVSFQVD